ncbi:MAG: hypothetical protein ABI670_03555 [Chloroflexota bacterium]
MARIVKGSKRIIFGTAFVSVMVGAGGLFGALIGVIFALLARSVLGINTGTGEFIAAWTLAGGLVAMMFGLYLTLKESRHRLVGTRVTASNAAVAETAHN